MSLFELVTALLAIISLIIGAKQFYKQYRLKFYEQYTERCMLIMKEMPSAVLYKDENAKLSDYETKNLKKAIYLYFDLCSEEYYLVQHGYIEQQVWNDWKDGMQDFFSRKIITMYLQEISKVYADTYADFIDFLKYELLIKNI